ncbi:MAG TPA: LamG-like jellyroll fold domain-containing protein [Verrucomicrobiae bacterium]|nr:LamG-like jellyroll fold domain-containing protein [Verrucomicrobiae bacterium]
MKKSTKLLSLAFTTLLLPASQSTGFAQATLVHRYSFNDAPGSTNFVDSVGGAAWNGTLQGTAALDGTQLQLDGLGGFATLPAGIVHNYSQVSIEFWATFGPDNPVWTRTFAFGDQDGSGNELTGLDYCHYAGGNWQNMNFQTPASGVYANNPGGINATTNVHVTVVIDPIGNAMYYYNGVAVTSQPGLNNGAGGTVPAFSGLNDVLCLLGKSLYDLDPLLEGSLDEFRIYQGVLSPSALAINDASGPNNYVTAPGALSAVHLTSPTTQLVVNQNLPLLFTGDFANVTGVNLGVYGGATFTSDNTGVLTVNSTNGLVKALTPGQAHVVASFGGLSATNALVVAAVPATLTHRYSFTSDASDSIGGANGTLMGSATISGGQVVLDGSGGTYVDLPGDIINIATNQSVTIEAWVTFGDVPGWSRLFDFGAAGGSTEFYMAPAGPGNGGEHRSISENFAGGQTIDWQGAWTNLSVHVTCVLDPPTGTLAFYKNGVLEYARYDASAPLSLVATNLAVLGESLVAADPYMPGSIDEFRIYSGALTAPEIAVSDLNGPNSTSHSPGALQSIKVQAKAYPAYSSLVPPVVLATYANLTNFNLLPNNSASALGLTLTSSDPTVLQVLPNNMLKTFRPGKVTLTATYQGKSDSATVTVQNLGTLAHRYSFTTDASDSVGTANGTLQGNATVSGGSLVLDGTGGTYVELPPGLLQGYDAATIDTWVTFNATATWSRLWYFGDDRADEFYVAPSVNGGSAHWFSTGFPIGGTTITIPPAWQNQTLHITCVYGNGTMEYYTNGVLHGSAPTSGRTDEIGNWFSWIGRSPYADPYLYANIDEFRIYKGRLAPDEILATDVLGPDQLPTTAAPLTATVTGGNLVLSWPVAAAGFSVQARSSLGAGSWVTLTNAPTLNGASWQVSIPASGAAQFVRLWR